MLHLLFHLFDLAKPGDVALASVEGRLQVCLDELTRERRPDDLRSEAEHVHVVVLDALVRAVDVVADRRADACQLAGGDRRADARAADEDASLGSPVLDHLTELTRLVRVVDPHRVGIGAEVDHVVHDERLENRVP
jgi:hypothetical protein